MEVSVETFVESREGLCGAPWRSLWSSVEVFVCLHGASWRSPWSSTEVSVAWYETAEPVSVGQILRHERGHHMEKTFSQFS